MVDDYLRVCEVMIGGLVWNSLFLIQPNLFHILDLICLQMVDKVLKLLGSLSVDH